MNPEIAAISRMSSVAAVIVSGSVGVVSYD
jgi:hypothetical protein